MPEGALAILDRPAISPREKALWFLNTCARMDEDTRGRFVRSVVQVVFSGCKLSGRMDQIERATAYELQLRGSREAEGLLYSFSPPFLERRARALEEVTMPVRKVKRGARCTHDKCKKKVGPNAVDYGYGIFCNDKCVHAHLTSPNPATAECREADRRAQPDQEVIITMASKKKEPKSNKAKTLKAAKTTFTVLPGSKNPIDPDSKVRFKLGTRRYEVMAKIVGLVKKGKSVKELKAWMKDNVPGKNYWRRTLGMHPEMFTLTPDGGIQYKGPELKVVAMGDGPKKEKKSRKKVKAQKGASKPKQAPKKGKTPKQATRKAKTPPAPTGAKGQTPQAKAAPRRVVRKVSKAS